MSLLNQWYESTLQLSLYGAIAVCAVMLFHVLAGRALSPRARYALWFLVVARLALPFTPDSAWSVMQWIPSESVAPVEPE